MRFVTFNICGINNVLSYHPWNEARSFEHMFSVLEADVICLQETKLQPHLLKREHAIVPGYDSYWSFSNTKKGYSGVVVYVKHGISVARAEEGLTGQLVSPDSKKGLTYQQLYERQVARDGASKNCIGAYPEGDPQRLLQVDSEGRSILLDLGFCVLFGLYCPSTATEGEERDAYRDDYFALLEERVNLLLEAGREVVVMGDLNVARELYDSAEGMQALHKARQITLPSLEDKQQGRFVEVFEKLNPEQCKSWRDAKVGRRVFHRLVPALLQDSCRDKHPNRPDMYTCWNVMMNYRPGNFGSRIDYVLASKGLRVESADILPHLEGSDHCPVYAEVRGPDACQDGNTSDRHVEETHDHVQAPKTRPKLFHRTNKQFVQTASVVSMFRAQTPPTKGVSKPKTQPKNTAKKQAAISAFFQKPEPAVSAYMSDASAASPKIDSTNVSNQGCDADSQVKEEGEDRGTADAKLDLPEPAEWQDIAERVEEAEKVASQWSKIMTKKPAPVCGHNLPAVLRTTRKKGPNQGKHFWVCGQNHSLQLAGDSSTPSEDPAKGGKEPSTTTRCNFFQWK
ncbi:DNA-(apurinic or apyrimidinic site) lyase 2 [Yarrowia sp. C11]|nr:DNA-(apurinic or apyrimidinic site) lyase 2 [Yarrowia sp. C11]